VQDTLVVGSGAAAGVVASSGNFDVTLQTGNATTTVLNITDGANGDITATMNGTGKFEITGTTEANIGLKLTTGDLSIADGSVTIVDDDAAASLSVTNNSATTLGAAASTGVANIVSTSLTTGALLNLETTEATLNGGWYVRAWDVTGGGAVFSVGEDGLTTIAGAAAGTNAVVVTAGDIFLSDSDASKFESEDGVGTLMTLDNKAGVIASDTAVLLLDAGGAVASGGNILRVAPTGAPNAGAIAIEVVGASKTCQMMYIDGDSTAAAVVAINGGGALTNGLGVLNLTNDGNLATGGNVLNITMGGTPHAEACAFEIAAAVDARAIDVASSAATASAVRITGAGATATTKATLEVISSGTPAAATSDVLRVAFTGTATNKPIVAEITGDTKDCMGLSVDADPTTTSMAYFHSAGALAADKATVEIASDVSACNADSAVLRITQDHTTGVATVLALKQDDVDIPFITFETTIGVGAAIEAVGGKNLTGTHYVMVDIEGVGTRYIAVGTIA
jgi:hypothetical protein